jgi:hypothetical protein
MSLESIQEVRRLLNVVYGELIDPMWTPKAFKSNSSRYLWTDAFGVCNFISLHNATGEEIFLDQADALIKDVHNTLARYRGRRQRLGNATVDHPLMGGIRIGKDNELEDGQYFHYLTKWMFALYKMSNARRELRYNRWAVELAQAVHRRFVVGKGQSLRMYWKLSADLSYPITTSEGNLDAIDGLVIYRLLQEQSADAMVLQQEVHEMKRMVNRKMQSFQVSDELDCGQGLWLSSWFPEEKWSIILAERCMQSAHEMFQDRRFEHLGVHDRLMFREMGLTLGIANTVDFHAHPKWKQRVDNLHNFWSNHIFDRDADISPIMYATSILPIAFMSNRSYPEIDIPDE